MSDKQEKETATSAELDAKATTSGEQKPDPIYEELPRRR